jgi:hypothetical protein
VNPAHLWLGTIADNVRDMWAKGRENLTNQVRGERVNTAKLTAADVVAIRADPRSSLRVAPDYGVSPSMVRQIRARTSWRHV